VTGLQAAAPLPLSSVRYLEVKHEVVAVFRVGGNRGLATNSYAQEVKSTKAMFMVTGLHCPPCVTTPEGSLKKTNGVQSIKADFKNNSATVEFEESVISAQEIGRAMTITPHMMGKNMQYGILVLSVPDVKDEAAGKKATAALNKVEGGAKVTFYPKQEAIGIEFTSKGKVTSKQLIDVPSAAGLKGTQYVMAAGPTGLAMNGGNGSMPSHACMAMNNGAHAGHETMGHAMTCECAPPTQRGRAATTVRGGCGCR
jgi:copper chaperone CopZ